jgi:pimeloyl-ACP methyl ester carboxylesterase
MLHEGLGSVAMWRNFPRQVAQATGAEVVAYSRFGYGNSDPPTAPRSVRYLHEEALATLPALLDALKIECPVLFGHSDGASIALIHAGGARRPVAGVIAVAPHVMVEPIALAGIERAAQAYRSTDLPKRLARYHQDGESVFWAWHDIWLDPQFHPWNIEEYLPRIECPVLAIQGDNDEYGTMEQIDRIERQARQVQLLKIPHCGHSPHREQPEPVLEAVRRFVDALTLGGPR